MDCRSLADHRLAYLDYEGPISGGRGTVARWDCGTYVLRKQTDEEWAVDLDGKKKIAGRASLCRSAGNPNHWSFSLKP